MHAPIGLVACVALLLAAAGTALGAQSEAVRHAIRTETRLDLDRSAGHIARRGDETDDVTLDAPDASDDYDDDPVDPYDKNFCFDPKYRKRTLKLIKEMPFIGLFTDLKNITRFEASGHPRLFTDLKNITRFEASGHVFAKGHSYTVDMHFNFLNDNNVLMTEEGEPEAESQFEVSVDELA
ncbi:hypothetical protein FOA52_004560 [Chlamydomonas sp. UWO 241]|nr:hypothetical protein FOA52_004560 [Chlamydomonas sp. UWO 241]